MRELNECTAEVFRRSENRIKQRKRKRNHILTLCIPVCLVAVLWSVMLSQEKTSVSMDDASKESMEMVAESNGTSKVHSYVAVEVQNSRTSSEDKKIEDSVQITEIYSLMQELYETDGGETTEDYTIYGHETSGTSTTDTYTIIFISEDGSKTSYRLYGGCLTNEETGESVSLNENQLVELQKVLGLSV